MSRVSRWRDRRAAARLLGRLFAEHSGGPKSDDELTVEAWLWDAYGDPAVAHRARAARSGGVA